MNDRPERANAAQIRKEQERASWEVTPQPEPPADDEEEE